MSATDSGNLSPPDPKRRRTRKPAKHNVKMEDDFAEPYNMDMESGRKRLEEINAKFTAARDRLLADYEAEQRDLSNTLLKALEKQMSIQANTDRHSIHVLAEAAQDRLDAEERIQAHVDGAQARFERLETLLRVVVQGRIEEAEAALLEAGGLVKAEGLGVKRE
ncbi:hypothetical protein D7B24_006841 [Verticillium nonalfalfae]|uniref:Uncharacterized protein n=1 Tax=Verticillium nonalfalfae TaxID=1051616 RepID=A0A3M9YAM4_9PEZI|nr:uncharacterized protein D7B24_006841 [Verticillium nonalfalfae]RNJ56826.1 hypothetical protein D7B24_006841 [Verticillium nonalfalfae]